MDEFYRLSLDEEIEKDLLKKVIDTINNFENDWNFKDLLHILYSLTNCKPDFTILILLISIKMLKKKILINNEEKTNLCNFIYSFINQKNKFEFFGKDQKTPNLLLEKIYNSLLNNNIFDFNIQFINEIIINFSNNNLEDEEIYELVKLFDDWSKIYFLIYKIYKKIKKNKNFNFLLLLSLLPTSYSNYLEMALKKFEDFEKE